MSCLGQGKKKPIGEDEQQEKNIVDDSKCK